MHAAPGRALHKGGRAVNLSIRRTSQSRLSITLHDKDARDFDLQHCIKVHCAHHSTFSAGVLCTSCITQARETSWHEAQLPSPAKLYWAAFSLLLASHWHAMCCPHIAILHAALTTSRRAACHRAPKLHSISPFVVSTSVYAYAQVKSCTTPG